MTVLKKIIVIIMCLFTVLGIQAQGISVASFKMLPNDLTANTNGTEVLDQNGDKAALIKVVTTQTGFTFEGGSLGICSTKQKNGEIWVYIPQKSKKITLLHQSLGVLRDYYFPCAIESARTYEMQLTSGSVQTVIKKDIGGNFFALKVLPENASVYIDGVLQINDVKGEYSIFLDYGEHQYRVEAGSYSTQSGIVNISDKASELNIKLESVLASLSIICPTQDAEIYLNKNKKGIDKWEGNVLAGKYLIEAKKEGYRSIIENIEVHEKENKTITLPTLQPIYGVLKVNVRPIGSVIEIDGNVVGKTPTVLDNVIVGRHSVKIKAPNGIELVKQIVIKEGEICEVVDVVPEASLKQLDSIANSTGDYTMAFKVAVESAEKGDAFAQDLLGRYYFQGSGVPKDYSKAVEWFQKAAEQGDAAAQCNLGMYYVNALGVSQNYSKAVKWFRKSAEQGNADAQFNLGLYYDCGIGVSEDKSKAVEWYRKSAEQGHDDAQYKLALCYYYGHGVAIDKQKAKGWLEKSAKSGNVIAKKILKEKF